MARSGNRLPVAPTSYVTYHSPNLHKTPDPVCRQGNRPHYITRCYFKITLTSSTQSLHVFNTQSIWSTTPRSARAAIRKDPRGRYMGIRPSEDVRQGPEHNQCLPCAKHPHSVAPASGLGYLWHSLSPLRVNAHLYARELATDPYEIQEVHWRADS
jgi:hypothetical protein